MLRRDRAAVDPPLTTRLRRGAVLEALCVGVLAVFATGAAAAVRPNVLVVETDDQTVADMRVMPWTQSLIGDQGVSFDESFVSDSLCCPSRAAFLTGQYAHNNGVTTGNGFLLLDGTRTLAVWLHDAGYRTGLIGKYVNGYGRRNAGGPTLVPPGWSEWDATIPFDQAPYEYDLSENGTVVHYGGAPSDFKGTILTAKALDFLSRNAPSPVPFFLWVTYTSPHNVYPFDGGSYVGCDNAARPAPGDVDAFANAPVPKSPSFDEADVSDKPDDVSRLPGLGAGGAAEMERQIRCRLAALQYVDRAVAQMVGSLRDAGELNNTLIIFTSDNGMVLGEHRIPGSKIYPYEESIRVPLLMRGPRIPPREGQSRLVANIDLAPTILDAAGVAPGRIEDGTSLLDAPAPRRDLVIESYVDDATHTPYAAVRTERYLYAEYAGGQKELYDLQWDPYQLDNRAGGPGYEATEAWLANRLEQLRDCAGAACRSWTGTAPDPPASANRPPQTSIDKHPRRRLKVGKHSRWRRVGFRFSADEPATFECRRPFKSWRPCSSPVHFRARLGRLRFAVRATDAAGNPDPTPAVWRWSVRRRH